jgi:hypothetical protein
MDEPNSDKKQFCFALLVIFVFFLFLEITARFLGFADRIRLHPLDTDFGWRMEKPSHGFTPAGARAKYILLGDSITYLHSEQADSLTQRLVREYHQPIINLSGIGYSTIQEFILLKTYQKSLPEVKKVILNFCVFNDFVDNITPKAFNGYIQRPQRTKPIQYSSWDYFLHWFRDQTGTYYLLAKILRKLDLIPHSIIDQTLEKKRFDAPPPTQKEWDQYYNEVQKGLPVTREVLQELNSFVTKEMNAELIVLLHPSAYYPDDWNPFALKPEIKTFFSQFPFAVYDLGCFYQANHFDPQKILWDRPGHLFYSGHFAVARWLDEYFRGTVHFPECLQSSPPKLK